MANRVVADAWIQGNQKRVESLVETRQAKGKYQQLKNFENNDNVDVHTYDGPQGTGYIIRFTASEGKNTFIKEINKGSEQRIETNIWKLQGRDSYDGLL